MVVITVTVTMMAAIVGTTVVVMMFIEINFQNFMFSHLLSMGDMIVEILIHNMGIGTHPCIMQMIAGAGGHIGWHAEWRLRMGPPTWEGFWITCIVISACVRHVSFE